MCVPANNFVDIFGGISRRFNETHVQPIGSGFLIAYPWCHWPKPLSGITWGNNLNAQIKNNNLNVRFTHGMVEMSDAILKAVGIELVTAHNKRKSVSSRFYNLL
jgi:hypothetical protein